MSNLEKALDELLKGAELTSRLASVLAHASERGGISDREVDKIVHDNAEDVLLLDNEWRLLLPVRKDRLRPGVDIQSAKAAG
jgi:hypothetical protein